MSQKVKLLGRALAGCATFLASLLIAWIGLSTILLSESSSLALSINPFNDVAARTELFNRLSLVKSRDQAILLTDAADNLVNIAPIDARSHSLRGEVLFLSQKPKMSAQAIAVSLRLAQTDLIGLTRDFINRAQQGDLTNAFDRLDVLYRRWPDQIERLAPVVASIARRKDGYGILIAKILSNPPWRSQLLTWMSKQNSTSGLAYTLLLDLAEDNALKGQPKRQVEIETGIRELIKLKKYELAHGLFIFTLNKDELSLSDYVFDSQISRKPNNLPFFWELQETNATTGVYQGSQDAADGVSAIRIDFLNRPVQWTGLRQFFRLAPGRYKLNIRSRSDDLSAPLGLSGNISCPASGLAVGHVSLPTDNAEYTDTTLEFEVPNGCSFARFMLSASKGGGSFKDRYSGSLYIASISIGRL